MFLLCWFWQFNHYISLDNILWLDLVRIFWGSWIETFSAINYLKSICVHFTLIDIWKHMTVNPLQFGYPTQFLITSLIFSLLYVLCFLNRQLQMFYFQVYLFLHDWDDCYLFKLFNPIITFCSLEIVFFNDFYCTIHISCSFFVFVKYFSPLFLFAVCWLVFYWVYYDYFWIICQAINSFNLLLVASVHEFLGWGYICLTSPDICRIVLSLSWMKLIKFFSLSRLVS